MASPPILVAIMGVTGSGKTSYVAGLTGRADIVPSEGLDSCQPLRTQGCIDRANRNIVATDQITAYDTRIDGKDFCIVDTPGFNDTYNTEFQVLTKLADWLGSVYRDGRKLTGLIYLHSIAKSRMTGTSKLNLSMFQKICGEESYQNLVLCTTFWDSVDQSVGEKRESQLLERMDHWGGMIQKGAMTERIHDYSDPTSRHVLLRFAEKKEVVLTIQKEMVDDNQTLEQTAAGQVVNGDLDQATSVLESLRIRSDEMEHELARCRTNHLLQNQQIIEQQQSVQNLDVEYREKSKEHERHLLEAKEEEKRLAEDRLRRQKEENRKAEEQRAAAEKARAVRETERRKLERKSREDVLRQRTSEQFRKIFAKQCQTLNSVQGSNNLALTCYRNEDQHAGYLRWCDHCFVPLTTQYHYRR